MYIVYDLGTLSFKFLSVYIFDYLCHTNTQYRMYIQYNKI